MKKTLYLPIDTTFNFNLETPYLIKKGDTLAFKIALYKNGLGFDLTGQTIGFVLKKKDGTYIEREYSGLVGNEINITDIGIQSTTCIGEVKGELQITDAEGTTITNTFEYVVQDAIAEDVARKSEDDIKILQDMRQLILKYEVEMQAIGTTVDSIDAFASIKNYIDTHIEELKSNNTSAAVNIPSLTEQNEQAEKNIEELKKIGDATELAIKVENNRKNKENISFYKRLLRGDFTKIKIIGDSNWEGTGVIEHIAIPTSDNGNSKIFDNGTIAYWEPEHDCRCFVNYFRKYINENFPSVTFINAAIGGKTAKFADENKQYWVGDNEDVLFVTLGTNDKYPETFEEYKTHLVNFLDYCATKCNLLIVGTPVYAANDYTNGVIDPANKFTTDDMEKFISKHCAEKGYFHISMLQGMKKFAELYNYEPNQLVNIDRVHLNADGHYIAWNVLQDYLGIKSDIGRENFHNNFKQIVIDGRFQVAQLFPEKNKELYNPSFGSYPICDMWKLEGDGTNLPAIAHQRITASSNELPDNMDYYRVYSNGEINNGQYLITQQYLNGIKKYLNGRDTLYVSFTARSYTGKKIACGFELNFGTGGSPSDIIYSPSYITPLTNKFVKYTFAISFDLRNKVFGTDNNDFLKLRFVLRNDENNISFNQGLVDIANVMMSSEGPTPKILTEEFDEALDKSLYYLEKSNEYSVLPTTTTPYTYENSNRIKYTKGKLIRPKVILYSWNNGAKNNISYVDGEKWSDSNSVTVPLISTKSAEINTTVSNYRYNYVIDARP